MRPRPGPPPRRDRRGAVDIIRLFIGAVLLVGLMMTMSWLQGRYDSSDHRKARELIDSYRARPGGPTIPEVIARRHPDVKDYEITWSSEITSSFQGIIRLTAKVAGSPASYPFDVRLTDFSIHPGDPAAIEVLRALTATTTATATAARALSP